MRGSRERSRGRLGIAEIAVDADIAGDFVPQQRRPGGGRRGGVGDGVERLVGNRDPFGRVRRGGGSLGDDRGDDVADEAHPPVGQHRQLGAAPGRAVRVFEDEVDEPGDHRIAGDRPHPVGGEVGGGQHVDRAGRRARRARVDADDAGMGVRRAQHDGIGLPVEDDVVGIAPAPAQEPQVFLPENRLSDPAGFQCRIHHCPQSIPKCPTPA